MNATTQNDQEIIQRLERDIKKYLAGGGVIQQLPPCTMSDRAKTESIASININKKGDKDE